MGSWKPLKHENVLPELLPISGYSQYKLPVNTLTALEMWEILTKVKQVGHIFIQSESYYSAAFC